MSLCTHAAKQSVIVAPDAGDAWTIRAEQETRNTQQNTDKRCAEVEAGLQVSDYRRRVLQTSDFVALVVVVVVALLVNIDICYSHTTSLPSSRFV